MDAIHTGGRSLRMDTVYYTVVVDGRKTWFKGMDAALAFADAVFKATGVVVGIEAAASFIWRE